MSSSLLFTAVAILVSIVAFIILHLNTNKVTIPGLSKHSNRQQTFIIAGLSNSGKTTLFNYLTNKKIIPTVTSQEPNITHQYKLPSTGGKQLEFKLSEFPGHPKLHNLLFDEIKSSSNVHGLIYVLDSTIDPKNITNAAKFLYEILNYSERRPGGIDILVACNKSDLFSSRPSSKIRESLEAEIDSIRRLNSANILKVDNEQENEEDFNDLGQSTQKSFKFDSLDANFDVISGSVLKQKVDKWECWIDERAVNY